MMATLFQVFYRAYFGNERWSLSGRRWVQSHISPQMRVQLPPFPRMTKTIEQLIAEFDPKGEHIYTKEDYLKEKIELERLLLEHYNLKPEEIEPAMREHLVPHEELNLVDRWICNQQFRPFVMDE